MMAQGGPMWVPSWERRNSRGNKTRIAFIMLLLALVKFRRSSYRKK